MVHFGARWYDPETGRWISKDPILLAGGLNLYAFCGNDPVNFFDPWGLCEDATLVENYNPLYAPFAKITGINVPSPDPTQEFLNNPSLETFAALMNDPAMQMAVMMSMRIPEAPVGSLKLVSAKWLKAKGVDPHIVKDGMEGGRMDVYIDKVKNIWIKGKGVADDFAETGYAVDSTYHNL